MSRFNRKEEIKNLPEDRRKKLTKYEKDLMGEIKLAELESETELAEVLLDFSVSRELADYYMQRYNRQARLINDLIKHKYVGTDYKAAQQWANKYSKEIAILNNLKYRFEEYQDIARNLSDKVKEADDRIDENLQERGYLDDMAKAPKKGPKSTNKR